MTESEEQIRTRLASIVDKLIQENPGEATQFQQLFGAETTGSQWLSYELEQRGADITSIAAGATAGQSRPPDLDAPLSPAEMDEAVSYLESLAMDLEARVMQEL